MSHGNASRRSYARRGNDPAGVREPPQPEPVLASDKQIVNAIEKTIGKYDFTGNSLRSSMHKDLSAIEDAVREMCRAQPDTTSCGF